MKEKSEERKENGKKQTADLEAGTAVSCALTRDPSCFCPLFHHYFPPFHTLAPSLHRALEHECRDGIVMKHVDGGGGAEVHS